MENCDFFLDNYSIRPSITCTFIDADRYLMLPENDWGIKPKIKRAYQAGGERGQGGPPWRGRGPKAGSARAERRGGSARPGAQDRAPEAEGHLADRWGRRALEG